LLTAGETVRHATTPARKVWVQVVRGQVTVNDSAAEAGDGIAIEGADAVVISAASGAEILLFDMD
jgi:quercetin 2,3-dioxygenase